jgi:AcrR family transcriptional regulator
MGVLMSVFLSEMATRTYTSPLRAEQTAATRERILEAVAELLRRDEVGDLSYRAIAEASGAQERTVYRHFPDKETLLKAFWNWLDKRFGEHGMPSTERDLVEDVKVVFARFDEEPRILRAALLSREGRALRMAVQAERVAGFEKALARATKGLTAAERRRVAAVVQLLYSGYAWMSMADHWGLTGAEAGAASSWAIRTLLTSLARDRGRRSRR